MSITGPQGKAARALIQWSRDHVARLTGLSADQLADFEAGRAQGGNELADRVRAALEGGGAVFIDENSDRGAGVRLKFPNRDLKPIGRMENEGGPVGDDDI